MFIISNPFFWAFLSMFGLAGGIALVSGIKLGRNPLIGFLIIIITDAGRIALTLPFCIQPRLAMCIWNWIIGGIILAIGAIFALPALSIKWWSAPDKNMKLKTGGVYQIVRNPIYLADILFSLGFAVMFGSIIGMALTPVWWIGFLLIILVEEANLERTLGQPYLDYKKQVKGRIIPGLPV